METMRYQTFMRRKEGDFEAACKRCGECCGASSDPCRNLVKLGDGAYSCLVYSDRLGPQYTVSGRFFTCVPIRDHIAQDTLWPGCAYRKPRS